MVQVMVNDYLIGNILWKKKRVSTVNRYFVSSTGNALHMKLSDPKGFK